MKPSTSHRVAAVAAALALVATVPAARAQAAASAAAPASAASVPATAVRIDVSTALNQAIDLYNSGKPAEARARVEQAMAAAVDPTAAEQTLMNRLRGLFALQLNLLPEAVQHLETALKVNLQPESETLRCRESLARAHFGLKNYAKAVEYAHQARADGSKSSAVEAVLVRATYLQNDFAGAARLLEGIEQRDGKLGFDDLRLLASAYGQAKDEANYVRRLEVLMREHGRTEYWPDLLSRVQRAPGWLPRWDVDLFRLRFQLDQMDEADDFLVLADLAAKSGLPAEAQKVLDAGYAKGMLGKGPKAGEHQKFRASMTKAANEDKASLASAAARAPAVGDARAATNTFNTGMALVSGGMAERGLELMKAALGGPVNDPQQARLQYAVSLAHAGRAAEADEAFKAVTGHPAIGLLARLWQHALAPKKS